MRGARLATTRESLSAQDIVAGRGHGLTVRMPADIVERTSPASDTSGPAASEEGDMFGATVGHLADLVATAARVRVGLAALTLGLFAQPMTFAVVQHSTTAKLTWAQIYALTPARVAPIQNPLVAVANPISRVGYSTMRDVYTTTALDTPSHAVDVYVTNPSLAGSLLQAARRLDPRLDLSKVRVKKAAYSSAALTAAGHRFAIGQ